MKKGSGVKFLSPEDLAICMDGLLKEYKMEQYIEDLFYHTYRSSVAIVCSMGFRRVSSQ